MTSSNRADVLKRLYAELKKKYTAVAPAERTVLEHFLYATCLEDATYDAANAAFTALTQTMSGWNEVRVSSVAELAELMPQLPDPRGAAVKIRKILHAVFEERYTFDLEDIRKKNIKEAYEKLESIPGGTPFSINYTAQAALGRHGIPVGNGEKRLLYVLGIIDESDIEEREVTGLNRAIGKAQGVEFASLIHSLAAAFVQNPEARKIVSFLKAFAPDFRTRMPKRREVRKENTMETPEPVVTHEVSHKNMMELLINDPDFQKERKEDRYEEDYMASEERAKEEYLEEAGKNRRKFRKGDFPAKETAESPSLTSKDTIDSKKSVQIAAEQGNASSRAAGSVSGNESVKNGGKASKKSVSKMPETEIGSRTKSEKAEKTVKVDKMVKDEKAAKSEKSLKAEKSEKTSKSEKTGKMPKKNEK